ncbi:MAG: sulfurtransferase TusA family protein [Pseudomonadota bacterium]
MTQADSFDAVLDATGLKCPLPLLKARQAIMVLDKGARICVLATDPGAPRDFEEFVDATGHILVSQAEADGVFTFVLEKS